MKNIINFENGISHEFTNIEINLLKTAIQKLYESEFTQETEKIKALEKLKSLFLDHLD